MHEDGESGFTARRSVGGHVIRSCHLCFQKVDGTSTIDLVYLEYCIMPTSMSSRTLPRAVKASTSSLISVRHKHQASTNFPRKRRPHNFYDQQLALIDSAAETPAIASPEDEPEFKYTPKYVAPNVDHPSYRKEEIMDFRDRSAMYPPAKAVQRFDKLRHARQLGIQHTDLNKKKKQRFPLPTVPVRLETKVEPDKVQYQPGKVAVTIERREFFEGEEGAMEEMDWSGSNGEKVETEIGRVVEVRR